MSCPIGRPGARVCLIGLLTILAAHISISSTKNVPCNIFGDVKVFGMEGWIPVYIMVSYKKGNLISLSHITYE